MIKWGTTIRGTECFARTRIRFCKRRQVVRAFELCSTSLPHSTSYLSRTYCKRGKNTVLCNVTTQIGTIDKSHKIKHQQSINFHWYDGIALKSKALQATSKHNCMKTKAPYQTFPRVKYQQ